MQLWDAPHGLGEVVLVNQRIPRFVARRCKCLRSGPRSIYRHNVHFVPKDWFVSLCFETCGLELEDEDRVLKIHSVPINNKGGITEMIPQR
jgi:hypothetical protein